MNSNDREYSNKDITVFWYPSKCIHATTCYRELIEVFNPRKRPWVNMDGAPTERIIEVVDKCPTQALAWKWNDEAREAEHQLNTAHVTSEESIVQTKPVEIKLMKDGPLVVSGKFKVIGSNGVEIKSMSMTSFCRCGASNSMPFCDGTHRKTEFRTTR